MGQTRGNLRRLDLPPGEIRYALATHYRIDRHSRRDPAHPRTL